MPDLQLITETRRIDLELWIAFVQESAGDPSPLSDEALSKLLEFLRECQTVIKEEPRGKTEKITEMEWNLFFLALERSGHAIKSARLIGRSRARLYQIRQVNPEIKERWDDSILMFQANVSIEAHRRAVLGVSEPVFQQGERVGEIRKYSDALMTKFLHKYCGFGSTTAAVEEKGIVILPGILNRVSWEEKYTEGDK